MKNHVAIMHFISDFKLVHPGGTVSFPARVLFHISEHTKIRYTEVNMMNRQKEVTIHLINPDLPFEDLPDTFMSEVSTFKYVENYHLTIASRSEPGVFVKIYPVVIDEA